MSSDNLQMHQINSSGESHLANSQNSNSSTSMQKSANIQFVSDSPITDPGQTGKVSGYARVTLRLCLSLRLCDMFTTHFLWRFNYLNIPHQLFVSFIVLVHCLQAM